MMAGFSGCLEGRGKCGPVRIAVQHEKAENGHVCAMLTAINKQAYEMFGAFLSFEWCRPWGVRAVIDGATTGMTVRNRP
jgi:hypothetical protein